MRYTFDQFKELLPEISWSVAELAEKLSLIGFEAEPIGETGLEVTLTANRSDCKDIRYLVFDLAGVYNFKTIPGLIDFSPGKPIAVTVEQINRLLGSDINLTTLQQLERLGFIVTDTHVTPPDFRDVTNKADVAEEVVRIIGYRALAIAPLSQQELATSPSYESYYALKKALQALGLNETLTNSFASDGAVELKNPFSSEEPYLRANLQTGLLTTVAKNPYLRTAGFYEIGDVFRPNDEVRLGVVLTGYKAIEDYQQKIQQLIGGDIAMELVDSATLSHFNVKQPRVFYGETVLSTNLLSSLIIPERTKAKLPIMKPLSKFPPLVRDVTLCGSAQAGREMVSQASSKFPELLFSELIDEYHDPASGRQTVTFRFLFQKMDHTFTDAEIRAIDEQLHAEFSARQ